MGVQDWATIVTTIITVIGAVYATFSILMKPTNNDIKEMKVSNHDLANKLDRYFERQQSVELKQERQAGTNNEIKQRLDQLEDDVKDLKKMFKQIQGEDLDGKN